jgi:hypothetical protein
VRKLKFYVWFIVIPVLTAGCNSPEQHTRLMEKISELRIQQKQLSYQLQQEKDDNQKLTEQIKTLSAIKSELTLGQVYNLQSVSIGNFTNLYDKDKTGNKETITVYLKVVDKYGDEIKAPGFVEIQLWDLQRKPQKAKLKQWDISAGKLAENWYSTVISSYYRLEFVVDDIIEKFDHPLTVKVKFTDILTGKVFNDQKVIEP